MDDLSRMEFARLKELADGNRPEVLKELGDRYNGGIGCPRDPRAAEKYYILAAQMGSADACLALGLMYEAGDKETADKYFYAGFRKGNAACTYRFARSLMDSDETEALELLTFGAINGGVECAMFLKDYYLERGNRSESEYFDRLLSGYLARSAN